MTLWLWLWQTSTGAYIHKLTEDIASLGQSGYATEKAAKKQARKDKALMDKPCTEYSIAVGCGYHTRPHAGTGARILRGLYHRAAEQGRTLQPAQREVLGRVHHGQILQYLAGRSGLKTASTRPHSMSTCATTATIPRTCRPRPRCRHPRKRPNDYGSPPAWMEARWIGPKWGRLVIRIAKDFSVFCGYPVLCSCPMASLWCHRPHQH